MRSILSMQMPFSFRLIHRSAGPLILFACLALAAACRSSRVDKSDASASDAVWQRTPLVIDGSDADWKKPLPYYDKKEKISYSVTNDKNNLYILLSARGADEQRKILEGGLTVWINNQAQKSNGDAVGIAYPTGRKPTHDQEIMSQARPDMAPAQGRHSTRDDLAGYTLYGFDKDSTVQTYNEGDSNAAGVQVRIGFNSLDELVYEAAVPLSSIYPQNSSHNFAGKSIAVGIFVEGLPPAQGGGMRRGGMGGSGVGFGGGFGMGGFGSGAGIGMSFSPGAFGRGGRGNNPQLYDQAQIWQTIALARPAPAGR